MLLFEQIYSLRNPSGKPALRNSEIKASVIIYCLAGNSVCRHYCLIMFFWRL